MKNAGIMLDKTRKIHFVGIGGIGMSAIAQILHSEGYIVSGSDSKESDTTRQLIRNGITCFNGHKEENVSDKDIVVYSSAIKDDNPEIGAAVKNHLKIMHRSSMLAEILKNKKCIAVTGSHGKTTTSSLIALIFKNAGLNPKAAIGGEVIDFGSNFLSGSGKYFIVEADESDGSFLKYKPHKAVLLNIDKEHIDYFKNMDNALKVYRKFIDRITKKGTVYYNIDDKLSAKALSGKKVKRVSFGINMRADVRAVNIKQYGLKVSFDCVIRGKSSGRFIIPKPGKHNVINALAAIAVSHDEKILTNKIKESIAAYKGTKRRFEIKKTNQDVMVVEDYAHHPTEINAVIEACGALKRNVTVVFQPHRYTRTKELFNDFVSCFDRANRLILTNIYAASEKTIEGVNSVNLCEAIKNRGTIDVEHLDKSEIVPRLKKTSKSKDMILILGAGDINEIATELEKFYK